MTAKIPAFTDIGKSAREVLTGGKEGIYQYNQTATISSKTADGIEFVASSVRRNDNLETAIKAGYSRKNISTILSFSHLGKASFSVSASDVAPGLSASLVGTLPDPQSLKLGLDYYLPHFTFKGTAALTASPIVNASVSTGWNDFTLGANFTVETAKNDSLSAWTAGLGYTGLDYQVAAIVADQGETVKLSGAHMIDSAQGLAAEIARSTSKDNATIVTLGYQRRLQAGALAKVRLANTGSLEVLYELEAQKNTKLSFSSKFDATNMEKAPKFGLAVDIKN